MILNCVCMFGCSALHTNRVDGPFRLCVPHGHLCHIRGLGVITPPLQYPFTRTVLMALSVSYGHVHLHGLGVLTPPLSPSHAPC